MNIDFTQEELESNAKIDDLIWESYEQGAINWDEVPVIVKKRIAARRSIAAKKSQGSFIFAPGFSFDSDTSVKLYS